MNMPQSMKIYRYPHGLEESEILEKINQTQKIDLARTKIIRRQGANLDSLEIKANENGYGVYGTARLWIKRKDNKFSEHTHLEAADISFIMSRSKKILLIYGSSQRDIIVRMISALIHDTQEEGYFLPFNIPKEKMIKLQKKLLGAHTKNCVEDPRFDTTTSRYKDRSRQGFERSPTACATEDREYEKILEKADNTYPIIRLIQCRGLLDDESIDFKPLEINMRGEFRFYQNISSESWNDFFFNVCQPILGVTVMN